MKLHPVIRMWRKQERKSGQKSKKQKEKKNCIVVKALGLEGSVKRREWSGMCVGHSIHGRD